MRDSNMILGEPHRLEPVVELDWNLASSGSSGNGTGTILDLTGGSADRGILWGFGYRVTTSFTNFGAGTITVRINLDGAGNKDFALKEASGTLGANRYGFLGSPGQSSGNFQWFQCDLPFDASALLEAIVGGASSSTGVIKLVAGYKTYL